MSKSLQEQLRELGLARDPPARRRSRGPGQKPSGKAPRTAPAAPPRPADGKPEPSLEQAYALRQREERLAEERARRDKLAAEEERRRINHAVRAIVEPNRLNAEDAEVPRYFLFRERIRKIHVTAAQLQALNAGQLGVIYLSGRYHLLDRDRVEQVRSLSPDHVPDLGGNDDGLEDDGVPDDLIW